MELFLDPFKIFEVIQPADTVSWKLIEGIVIDKRNISGTKVRKSSSLKSFNIKDLATVELSYSQNLNSHLH